MNLLRSALNNHIVQPNDKDEDGTYKLNFQNHQRMVRNNSELDNHIQTDVSPKQSRASLSKLSPIRKDLNTIDTNAINQDEFDIPMKRRDQELVSKTRQRAIHFMNQQPQKSQVGNILGKELSNKQRKYLNYRTDATSRL